LTVLKKIWNIVSTVLVVLMVLCAVFLVGSRLFGYQCYTVLTGSMEPSYAPGDLIYVKEVYPKDFGSISDPAELEKAKQEKIKAVQELVESGELAVGDPISFVKDEKLTVATHRIVEIDGEAQAFITKGDTNEDEDDPVSYLNLIGEVSFSLPKLGYVSGYIQNPPGTYVVLGAGILLILLVFLPDMLGKKKKEDVAEKTAVLQTEVAETAEENEKLKAELERLRAEMEEKKDE